MIKQFFKKVLISYLIIICCIYTPTAQAAGWSFGGFNFGSNSLNIVKDGVKITTAAVDSAPITRSLGAKILGGAIRGANIFGAISAITGLALDAIDWVLDPANNAIKVTNKNPPSVQFYAWSDSALSRYNSAEAAGAAECALHNQTFISIQKPPPYIAGNSYIIACRTSTGGTALYQIMAVTADNNPKTIPIPTVAQKIYDMAKSGDTAAQADVTSVVTDLVSSGTYDTPINQAIQQAIDNATLPKTDTNSGTGTNSNTTPSIDTSSITAAIQSLASSFAKSLTDNFNAITSVINTSIDKLLNKQDQMQGELVNTGSKVDSMGGKVEGLNDNVKDVGGKVVGVGEAVKDVGGKVVGLNDSVKDIGGKVVGLNDNVTTVGDKVTAVGDKVTGVGDKVSAVGDKVTAVGDKVSDRVSAVGDKVTASNDKVADKVDSAAEKITNAIKDKDKDKPESKPFELPAFCDWAKPVCDFIEWVKKDPTPPDEDNRPFVKDDKDPDFNIDDYANRPYVQFSGGCPSPPVFNIFGGQIVFPMDIICKGCEQMSWVFVAFAWLRAVMIVFFGSKD